MLHGRQDNAGSFDKLIPLLPKSISVLCLDLPGHGLSSHYPEGEYYYVHWEGAICLRRIVAYFKWNKVSESNKITIALTCFCALQLQVLCFGARHLHEINVSNMHCDKTPSCFA